MSEIEPQTQEMFVPERTREFSIVPPHEPRPSWDYSWGIIPVPTFIGEWVEEIGEVPKSILWTVYVFGFVTGVVIVGMSVLFGFYLSYT